MNAVIINQPDESPDTHCIFRFHESKITNAVISVAVELNLREKQSIIIVIVLLEMADDIPQKWKFPFDSCNSQPCGCEKRIATSHNPAILIKCDALALIILLET
jgi:hypothetical protein